MRHLKRWILEFSQQCLPFGFLYIKFWKTGDEDAGYDKTLIPVDFRSEGHIDEKDLFHVLIKPMIRGVTVIVLMDCCHSGIALDLPYMFSSANSETKWDEDTAKRVCSLLVAEQKKHLLTEGSTIVETQVINDRIVELIPADFRMISSVRDLKTLADVNKKLELPNPSGKASGVCTSALLKVLYSDEQVAAPMSFAELLCKMKSELHEIGDDQIPQLTSSRMIDVKTRFEIVPNGSTGIKRAILIGINYTGQTGELRDCHKNVDIIKMFLKDIHGFEESDILVLLDDGTENNSPNRRNITDAFTKVCKNSKTGDVVFVHYSGHSGRVRDKKVSYKLKQTKNWLLQLKLVATNIFFTKKEVFYSTLLRMFSFTSF